MADETDYEPSPQLTGIVIITLPPPDNPSFGKTITAFTLSDNHISSTTSQSTPPPNDPSPSPSPPPPPQQSPSRRQSPSSLGNFSHRRPSTILPILCICFIALYCWSSISQEEVLRLRDDFDNDDDEDDHKNKSRTTFLFPLYRKPYRGNGDLGDVELKLGRLRGLKDSAMRAPKINKKSVSAASKIDSATVIPVGGNIHLDGLYYTFLHFGNPPRPYFLDIDTGSDLTWVQCDAPCTSCAKGAHPFYKPGKDNIILPKDSYCHELQKNQMSKHCDSCLQCDYEIEYADHSSSMGVLARDEVSLNIANGSLVKSKVVFGCAYDQQGLLLNTLGKTDGILSLSRAKISLPSQLASEGITNNIIGHCLATDTVSGGYLFFGDDFVPHSQMAWVPMLQSLDSNSYQAEITEVNYGRRQIDLGDVKARQRNIIFDTGSSYSYFPEEAYTNLVTLLNDISNESIVLDTSDTSLPICWRSKSPLRSVKDVKMLFKPLNLHFRSTWWILSRKLQIPPEGYLVINKKGNVCLGILNGNNVHDGSTFILGDISLQGLLVVYDNVNKKIGWVRSDCARPRQFESNFPNPGLGL
ncbi:aspartyl protease APCB1-like [Salvia splendens]|uniref:aspartyl protease APCB1-like n=1 Tax=Salvia splendens TaxID=180675 RepID=UPI001C26BF9A|nr:aspartyl protease APCB1-like [Salvia splendens]